MTTKRQPVIWVVRSWSDPDFRILCAEIRVKAVSRDQVKLFMNNLSEDRKTELGWRIVKERWVTIGRKKDGVRGDGKYV